MAGEPNQIKWVGVRPTDPAEAIPVTTKKPAPAISDLQAIKAELRLYVYRAAADCSVSYYVNAVDVLPGEIWVYTNLSMWNETSRCDMSIKAEGAAGSLNLAGWDSYEPFNIAAWAGMCVMEAGRMLRFRWENGGAADKIYGVYGGYKIGAY